MVWFLLGLLFNAGGLYLGFDYRMAFVYMIVGWFCCAYGIAVYVLQRLEKPKTTQATRLSKNFISSGATIMMHSPSHSESSRSSEKAGAL